MPRNRERPVENADGYETHPAFGMCRVNRVSSTPGKSLFQSDLQHREYIQLTVSTAERKRDLKHDWVHAKKTVIEVAMSLAQFASMVTSAGTEGVPVTIGFTAGSDVPELYPDSRLRRTADEVLNAADEAYGRIRETLAAYEQAVANKAGAVERRELLRTHHAAVANAVPNVNYATTRLAEHAEEVVEKSRADIEAMVMMAQQRGEQVTGLDSGPLLSLEPVRDETSWHTAEEQGQ